MCIRDRGYFAHAGNWYELVNKETNGVVGTGTETYNVGNLVSVSSTATSFNVTGVTTVVTLDVNGDIDVDGHTNLDNLNIAGVSTFAGTLNASTVSSTALIASGDLDVDGHTNLDNVNIAGVTTTGNLYADNLYANSALTLNNNASVSVNLTSTSTTGSSRIFFGDPDSALVGRINYAHNGDFMQFYTAYGERLRITSAGHLKIPDNAEIRIGNAQTGDGDMKFYHNGSNSFIQHLGTGGLYIDALNNSADIAFRSQDNINFYTNAASQSSIACVGNGGVILYNQGNARFNVDNDGAVVTEKRLAINRNAGDPYLQFQTSGTTHATLYGGSSTGFRVFTGSSQTERLRIKNTGGVGITTDKIHNASSINIAGVMRDYTNTGTDLCDAGGLFLQPINNLPSTGKSYPGIFWTGNTAATARARAGILGVTASNNDATDIIFLAKLNAGGAQITPADERMRLTNSGQLLVGATSSTGARGIIQQNSSSTNPYAHGTCADSSGLRLQNYSFGVGRYTALSLECANSSTVQSASIIAQSVNSGQAPSIIFAQRTSNTANTERMRINEDGYVTKSNQPRAVVKIYGNTTISNGKVDNWATPIFNVGSLWDTTNKRFVAPTAGLYLIGGNFRIGAPGKIRVTRFEIRAYNSSNGHMATYGGGFGGTHNYDGGSGGYDHPYVSFTNAIYLTTGQYLELWLGEVATEHTSYIQDSNEQSHMWCVLLQ